MTRKTKQPVAAPKIPVIDAPAIFVNHAHASWRSGVVRLTLSEDIDGEIAARSAVMMTLDQLVALRGLLDQAITALSPREDSVSAEGV